MYSIAPVALSRGKWSSYKATPPTADKVPLVEHKPRDNHVPARAANAPPRETIGPCKHQMKVVELLVNDATGDTQHGGWGGVCVKLLLCRCHLSFDQGILLETVGGCHRGIFQGRNW